MAAITADDFDPNDPEAFARIMASMPREEFERLLDELPPNAVKALLAETSRYAVDVPESPLAQAFELDPKFVARPHLEYLSDRITAAYHDVKNGHDRMILVAMPPRAGKSAMVSKNTPIWLLRREPSWKFALISYSPTLAVDWSRQVRSAITQHGAEFGVQVAPDAGAVGDWKTTAQGEVHARSMGQGMTGFGANVLLIDDPVKDSLSAHSANYRQTLWERYTANLQTRREPPSLTIVVQTRWHEDDLAGRLLNPEIEGAVPDDWEVISLPAIAEANDVLGREPGEPLYPPLLPMDRARVLAWWSSLQRSMSSYDWSAQYQQRPAPSQGAVFNNDWWNYWTTDPSLVTYELDEDGLPDYDKPDGHVILLPDLVGARHLDSWDLNFDDTVGSDFVVGQRWAQKGSRKFLLDQRRGRWDFPTVLSQFRAWNSDNIVHEHLVEKKANGAAMIKMLMTEFSGFNPVNPTASKEVRARAIAGMVERGEVYLPHPTEKTWVKDLFDELRDFPSGKHDDQVDALTQALSVLTTVAVGGISDPAVLLQSRRAFNPSSGNSGTSASGFQAALTAGRIARGYSPRRR